MFARFRLRLFCLAPLALVSACATSPGVYDITRDELSYPTSYEQSHRQASSKHQVIVSGDNFDYGKPYVIRAHRPLQCVVYARQESGIDIHGNANRWWSQAAGRYRRGSTPEIGAVMVLSGPDRRGHVAVVRRIVDSRTIIVDHSNWLGRGEINKDTPVRDVSDDNDWSQVNFWWIPGTHWGGRVNTVAGFIYHDETVASR